MKKKPGSLNNIRKIGVYIGIPGLGDLLFIIPLFRELKRLFPSAKTTFIGKLQRGYVRPVFDNCPYIDDLFEFHFYESRTAGQLLKFIKDMRKERFDLIVDTQRKFAPSMLLSLGGARYLVSYSSNNFFSDFPVESPDRDKRHTADISLDLVRALGAPNPSATLEIQIPEENRRYAEEFYSGCGVSPEDLLAGIIPAAGHHSRNWNSDKFAVLCDMLAAKAGCRVICFGSPADKAVIDEITSKAKTSILIEDFSRKSILDSAALMARCNVIVGVDSGPLHVADATGAPCVGIYGPTLPGRFGLLGARKREICLFADCTPCSDHNCTHRKCLEDISTETVYQAAVELLEN